MSHFFTLLCKLITVCINGKIVVPIKNTSAVSVDTDKAEAGDYPSGHRGGANDDLAIPETTQQPQRQRWLRFNIFSSLQINLAPVAAEQPVFAYTTNHTCTTQTNRMRQILRAAKSSTLCFFILLMGVFATKSSEAQTNTWTAGAATTAWGTAGNWSAGHVPTAGEDVVIGPSPTITNWPVLATNTTINSLTINGRNATNGSRGGSLSMNTAGITLTITGNLTLAGATNNGTENTTVGLVLGAASNMSVTAGGNVSLTNAAGTSHPRITLGTGTLNIGGSLTVGTSNTFSVNSGIVNFNGSVAQTIPIGQSNVVYGNITVNNTNATGAVFSAAVTATNVTGNITVGNITSGSLLRTNNFAVTFGTTKTLTVASGSTLNAGTSVISFGTGGTASISGTFQTGNTNGFSGATNTAINSNNNPTITLAAGSTVEYSAAAGGQAVTGRSYSNLKLSNTSNTNTAGGAVTVTGTLTTTAGGTFNMGTNALTVAAVSHAGILRTQNISATAFSSGLTWGGTVQFDGTGAQTVPASTFNNFTISNTSGATISSDITVNGTLNFANGIITTGANTLTIGTAGSITGAGAGKYVNGKLAFIFNSASSQKFEIGKGGNYRPVTFQYAGAPGTNTVTIEQFESAFPGTVPSSVNALATRYWSVTQSATGTAFNLTLDGTGFTTTGTKVILQQDGATVNVLPATFSSPNYTASGISSSNTANNFTVGETSVPTTTTVSNHTIVPGTSSVTLTANVTGSPAVNAGTVQFSVNGTPVGSPVDVTAGVATLLYDPSALSIGSYPIDAVYTPGGFYTTSNGSGTLAISLGSANVSVTGGVFTYDGNAHAASGFAYGNGGVGDVLSPAVTFSYSGTGTTSYGPSPDAPVNAGTYQVTASFAGNSSYGAASNTANITINAKDLHVSGITADNKTYDGNAVTTLTGTPILTVGEVVGSDDVTLNSGTVTADFADKNVGTNKSVAVNGFTISGASASNYHLIQPTLLTANISQLTITVSGITATKVYDGNLTAVFNVSSAALTGQVPADIVSVSGATGTYTDKNVGTGKTVNISAVSLTGADAANYTIAAYSISDASITQKSINVTGVSAANKVYDGNIVATLSGTPALSGVVAGDDVQLNSSSVSASFIDKNVGTGKQVSASGYTISGNDEANYSLVQPTLLSANITPVSLNITGLTADNKEYDGNTSAVISGTATLNGVLGSEDVTLNAGTITGAFDTKNIGVGKTITISGYTLTGVDAGNYSLQQPVASANITAKALTITGIAISNKVYDGNTTATRTGTAALNGVVAGDAVTLGGTITSAFADKNIGTAKPVTVSGYTITGAGAGNYTLTQPTGLSADITAKSLTITGVTASNKVYDGTVNATLTGTAALSGVVAGDNVVLSSAGATGSFVNKNVGTGKQVTTTGYTISGTDAANYSLVQPTLSANITAKALTITGVTANNKVYDGLTTATLNTAGITLNGVVSPDVVTIAGTGTGVFANKNTGTAKAVTVTGYTLTGADASNYSVSQPAGITADITQATLTYTATPASRTYGTTITGLAGTVTGFVSGETVANSTTGTAAWTTTANNTSPVGSYPITGSGLTANSGNYVFVQAAANATALTITQAALTITANAQAKCIGTTFNFTGNEFTTTPGSLPAGVSVTGVTFTSAGSAAGAAAGSYSITPSNATGTGLDNYTITYVNGTMTVKSLPAVSLSVPSTTVCLGSPVTLTAANTGGTTSGTYNTGTITLPAGSNSIPDNNTAGINNSIVLSQIGTISAISKITVTLNIIHTRAGDLTVTLTNPAGQTFTVMDGGTSSANLVSTSTYTFNSTSANAFPPTNNNVDLASGTFVFNNTAGITYPVTIAGTWTIHVEDNTNTDTNIGTFLSWGLQLNYDVPLYTTVFNGGGTFGTVNYNANHTSASVSVTPSVSGNYTATTTDGTGCQATSNTIALNVISTPAQPGAITGETLICNSAADQTYSVDPVSMADSYIWTVPAGWSIVGSATGNSITVTPSGNGGNITVKATNTCGTSTASSLSVVYNTPVVGVISGGTSVCPNFAGITYSVAPIPGATDYTWNLPANWVITGGDHTNSITVTSGNLGDDGNISVAVTNACGTSLPQTLAVVVAAAPTASISYAGTPFCRSISSPQGVTLTGTNAYAGGTYSSTAGLTINSSTGAITPSTSTAGTYTVTYTKTSGVCGTITATTDITITTAPVSSFTASATTVLLGNSVTFTNTSSNATQYLWTFQGITPGTDNTAGPVTVTYTAVGSYQVTLNASNGACTAGVNSIQTINVVATTTLTGSGSFIVPPGVTCLRVEAWGGGGAGGGASNTATRAGGGGAGGAYTLAVVSVTPGQSIPYLVGQGGTGVSAGNGNAGGSTTFSSTTPVTANGGGGGSVGDNTNNNGAGAAASTGTHNGGAGANAAGGNAGGGGGGAGNQADGGAASGTTAGTGGAGTAGAAGGNGGAGRTTSGDGNAGTGLASGGGGGRNGGTTSRTGGAGTAGKIILTWDNITVSNAPTITSTVCSGTNSTIGGTAQANAVITIFKNGSAVTTSPATITTTAGGNWTATISSSLAAGDEVKAQAQVPGNCISSLSSPVTVSLGITSSYTVSGGGSYCSNEQGSSLAVILSGSDAAGSGMTYELYKNGAATGNIFAATGAGLNFGIQTTSGTYTVVAKSANGCTLQMSGSAVASVKPAPAVTLVADATAPICLGSSIKLTNTTNNNTTTPGDFTNSDPNTTVIPAGGYTTYAFPHITIDAPANALIGLSSKVSVSISFARGYSDPQNLDMFLVAPGSTRALALSMDNGVWGATDASAGVLTLTTDNAFPSIGNGGSTNVFEGTYRSQGSINSSFLWSSPPAGTGITALVPTTPLYSSEGNAANIKGNWTLMILDDGSPSSSVGAAIYGWSITITTPLGYTTTFSGSGIPTGTGQPPVFANNGLIEYPDIIPAATGDQTYSTTTAAANGCSATTTTVVTVKQAPTSLQTSVTDVACKGGSTGSIDLTPVGGTPSFNYAWTKVGDGSFSASTEDISDLTIGTYHVVVTVPGLESCKTETDVTVQEPADVLSASAVQDAAVKCKGESNGTATVTAAGGNGSYSYLWDNNETTATAIALTAGSHSVTITDIKGCSTTANVTIDEPAEALAGSIEQQVNIGCGVDLPSTGSVKVTGSGGTIPYSFSINVPGSNSNTDGVFNGLPAGGYMVTIEDANGCTFSVPVTITEVAAPTTENASVVECAQTPLQTLTASASVPEGSTVKWYNLPSGGTEVLSPTLNTVGTVTYYAATVNEPGCESIQRTAVTLTIKALPNAPTSGGDQEVCSNGNPAQTLTATASISGGTVVWYTDATGGSLVANPVQTGVGSTTFYAESLVDGCSSATRTAVKLTIYPAATELQTPDPITEIADNGCTKEQISFTPPYTISEHCSIAATGIRLNAAGQLDPLNTLDSPFPVGTTTIRWEANVNGQTLTSFQQVIVLDKTPPVPNVPALSPIQVNGCSATITTIPTANDDCAGIVNGTTSSPLSYNTPGTYTIVWVYSDGHGNSITQTQDVIIEDQIDPVPVLQTLPTLTGQCSVTVTDIPKANDNCAGTITGTTNSPLSYNIPGTYTIVWTYDDGHGNAITQPQTVTVTGLTAFAVTSSGSVCNGGVTISLGSSQTGVSYQLVRDGSTIVDSRTGFDGLNLSFNPQTTGGVYTVRAVANTGGCSATMNGTVTLNSGTLPTAYTVAGGGSSCGGGNGIQAIILPNSQSGVTYYLLKDGVSTGVTRTGIDNIGQNFGTPTEAGTYTILAVSAGGCQNTMTGSAIVSIGTPPQVFNVSISGSPCNGGVHVRLSGSQSGISYVLAQDGFATGSPVTGAGLGIDFGVQAPGSYTVIATNTSSNCTSDMNGVATVLAGAPPQPFDVTGGGVACNGVAVVGLTGSETSVNYQLKSGNVNVGSPIAGTGDAISFGVQAVGTYTVVATNPATLCANNMNNNVTITAGSLPVVTTQPQSQAICSGTATFTVAASGTGLSYKWQLNGSDIQDATSDTYVASVAGSYTAIVSNSCGSVSSNTATLTVNTAPSIASQPAGKTICSGATATLVVSANGTGPLQYQWNLNGSPIGGANSNFYDATIGGDYTVDVSNGCSSTTSSIATVIVNAGPSISVQPAGSTICAGGSVSLTVAAGGSGVLQYQWHFNGADINNATSASYTASAAGNYSVTVSNSCGSVNSSVAALVVNSAPSITLQPVSKTICAGSTNTFTVVANGTAPLQYQWNLNGSPIVNATNNFYEASDAGDYTVDVTNACGTVTSVTATLTVNPVVTAGTINGIQDLGCPGATTTFTISGGTPNGVWSSDNTAIATVDQNGLVSCASPGSTTIRYTVTGCGGPQVATLAVTVRSNAVAGIITGGSLVPVCPNTVLNFSTDGTEGGTWSSSNPAIASVDPQTGVVTCHTAGNATISYTVTGCGAPVTSQKDVSVSANVTAGTITGSSTVCVDGTSQLTANNGTPGGTWLSDNVNIAKVDAGGLVTGVATGSTTIRYVVNGCTVETATFPMTVTSGIQISTQPQSQTICSGNATFSVVASGTGLSYQWKRGTTNVGTNNSSFTTNVAGTYTVVITSSCGSVTSDPATLTIGGAPSITTQPQSQTICSGNATFTVAATGTGLSYQWKRANKNVGTNSNSFSTNVAGNYTVVVTNSCGSSVTSNVAILTINNTVAITTQPQSQAICSGNATFTVAATGIGLSYQWKRGTTNVGTNSNTLTTNVVGSYTVVVTNSCGTSVTSNVATLTLGGALSITTQPQSQTICSGNATFTVAATGTGLSYQWKRGTTNVGTNSNTLTTNIAGSYSVVVTNSCGASITSNTVTLSITGSSGGTALANGYTTANVCFGNTVTLSLAGQVGSVTRWEFSYNGNSWQTISSTATTISRTIVQNTMFRAIIAISANCSPATSSIANVTVTSTGIAGTLSIPNTIVCRNTDAVFTLTGNSGTVIRWEYSTNGGNGSWTIDNNSPRTANSITYQSATANRRYRAVVAGCTGNILYSNAVGITITSSCATRTTNSTGVTKQPDPVIITGKLEATAYPNPSQTYFNLQVKSSNSSDVEIKVFDMSGKQVDQMRGAAYETYRFGNKLVAGTYIVEVRQGDEKVTTKIIKF